MTARLGSPDEAVYESPRPDLLSAVTGAQPELSGTHVRLDERFDVLTMQRLAIGNVGGAIAVMLWPAELKPQAVRLYGERRGDALVAAARRLGWTIEPTPHLAYHTAPPPRRLYMFPELDAEEYVRRWQEGDLRLVGAHHRDEVTQSLWPWLKGRGYASADDDRVLEGFLRFLGTRDAHLRPGLRLARSWERETAARVPRQELAAQIRHDVNVLLAATGEPTISF